MPITTTVVLDTNVLVSLLIFRDPSLTSLAQALGSDIWQALADESTLGEFERVLAYPEFGLAPDDQAQRLAQARAWMHCPPLPEPRPLAPPCRDEDDRKFLALARDAGAQWLITSDKALLAQGRRRRRHTFGIVPPGWAAKNLL